MAAERGGFDPDRIVSHGTERTPTSTALASVRGEMLPALAPHAALRLIRDWERDRTQSLNRLSSLIRQLNTASFAQSHLQMGAVQRRPASVGDEQLESRSLAGPVRQPDPSRHDDDVGVDRPEHIVKHLGCMLRRPLHSQCASVSSVITYPAIGRIRRSDFDLIFQGAELLPLRGFDKPAQVIENSTQAPIGEAVLCAMRVHDPFAPIVAGLEPPGSLPEAPVQASGSGSPQLPNPEHISGSSPVCTVSLPGANNAGGRRALHEAVPAATAVRKAAIVGISVGWLGANGFEPLEVWRSRPPSSRL